MWFIPNLSLFYRHALCFLYTREASLDRICWVGGGWAHHEILSEGETWAVLRGWGVVAGKPTQVADHNHSCQMGPFAVENTAGWCLFYQVRWDGTGYFHCGWVYFNWSSQFQSQKSPPWLYLVTELQPREGWFGVTSWKNLANGRASTQR